MKKLILISFLQAISITGFSQIANWQYFVESKGVLNQASHGNDLWLSTNAGLVKFNKTTYSYSIFDKINSPLPSNFITALTTDDNGDLWLAADNYSSVGLYPLAAYHSSLLKYDGAAWTEFNQNNSMMPDARIKQLEIDTSGNKWYLTDYSLVKFDGINFTVFDTSDIPVSFPYFFCFTVDINNNVWLGTYEGLFKFDGITWTSYNISNSPLLSNYVFALKSDSNGKLWIGTANTGPADGGLNSFDGSTWNSYTTANSGLPENWILQLAIDDSDHVWLSNESGLGATEFDGVSTWATYNTVNSGIISNYTHNLSADSVAWIGSYEGLSKFNGSSWTTFNFNQTGLPSNRIWDIAIDRNDKKYFPLDLGAGLASFDNSGWSVDTSAVASRTANLIETDSNNYIRKGSYWNNGLEYFNGSSWQSCDLLNLAASYNTMYSLSIDHLNNTWVGTEINGLGKFDGVSWTVYDTSNSAISSNLISSIDEDASGNIWLGNLVYSTVGWLHPTCGLRKFDGITFTQYDTTNSAITSNEISVVQCDHLNNVWFATPKGLSRFDGLTFTDFSPSDSPLPNSVIRCLAIDLNDVVWVGTDSGMLSYDGANWILYNETNSDLPLDGVSSIKVDSYNNKWIAFARMHPIGHFEGYGATVFNESGIQGIALNENDKISKASSSLYPNPFQSSSTLLLNDNYKGLRKLTVFDVTGKKLREKSFTGMETDLQRERLNNGIYLYVVTDNNGNTLAKGKFIIID